MIYHYFGIGWSFCKSRDIEIAADGITQVLLACYENGGCNQQEERELVVQSEDAIVDFNCVDLKRCFERRQDAQHFKDVYRPTRTKVNWVTGPSSCMPFALNVRRCLPTLVTLD